MRSPQLQFRTRQTFSPPPDTGTRVSRVSPTYMRWGLRILNLLPSLVSSRFVLREIIS